MTNKEQGDGEQMWDDAGYVTASKYRRAVLEVLGGGPTLSSTVAEEAGLHESKTSRTLTELRERSLVELKVSEGRRKGRIYGITEHGQCVLDAVREAT